MFALMNPPHVKHRKKTAKAAKKKSKKHSPITLASGRVIGGAPSYRDHWLGGNPHRKAAKNSWFGNASGHAAAAKKGWAKRRKSHGPKLKRASALVTPGGGRIFSVAANPRPFWPSIRPSKRNSFMGINPRGFSTTNNGGKAMSRKRHGGRRSRFNMGFSSPKSKGLLDAFKPSNLVGVTPILAGVILDGLVTKALSDKIPYTKHGIGNVALGIANAGLLGMLGRYANKSLGDGIFVGGMVGTLGCLFQSFMQDGLKSLSLGSFDSPFTQNGFQGMGAFITPQGISSAIPSGDTMSQYSLPAANAVYGQTMQMPQTPAQGHSAQHMGEFEGAALASAMAGNSEEAY